MTRTTTNLGGTAADVIVGKVAHGLMSMTWKPHPVPDEQCFEAIKAGVDALPPGAKMFLNGGEFYGHNLATTNLEMIARFFEKYPEYVDRTFLSIKGGLRADGTLQPDCSPENILRSVNTVNEKLRGTKRLDLFQCARVDPKVPVEVSIAALAHSRVKASWTTSGCQNVAQRPSVEDTRLAIGTALTIALASKPPFFQVHPISVVEIEISPFSYEPKARAVVATAKELGIAVAAYSPLGRGFLTGQIKKLEDLPADDDRRVFPRFQEENFKHNLAVVDGLTEIAKKKNVTTMQLCIGWVSSLGPHVIPLPGSSRADRTLENSSGGDVTFTETELQEINQLIEKSDVKGSRHPSAAQHLWA